VWSGQVTQLQLAGAAVAIVDDRVHILTSALTAFDEQQTREPSIKTKNRANPQSTAIFSRGA
jgi:hypothetical protein